MNILLIGHEGYLGRGLSSYLSRNHCVIGWDKREDIFKLDAAMLLRGKIEMLINLSVMTDRQASTFTVDEPCDQINVGGARHLANILKGSEISWIQMSTREVLGPVYQAKDVIKTDAGLRPAWLVGEDQPYAPANFYAKSKIMAEFISESHPYSAVIRLATCYTDYDHPFGNWIVTLIKSAVRSMPVHITRGGEQFRDPLHIDDLGNLIERIHGKKTFGEKFHAGGGGGNLISLKEMVHIVDSEANIQEIPGGDYGFAFNNQKATKLTGWEPKISFRERIPVIVKNIRQGIIHPLSVVSG